MRIVICSDEVYPLHSRLVAELSGRGHGVVRLGALADGPRPNVSWALVAEEAACLVASGACDQGIACCWSGTGICMASNKVPGIRAALCPDPGSARAAREWNDANVLCLSNRLVSGDVAIEILAAWFESVPRVEAESGLRDLETVAARHGSGRS